MLRDPPLRPRQLVLARRRDRRARHRHPPLRSSRSRNAAGPPVRTLSGDAYKAGTAAADGAQPQRCFPRPPHAPARPASALSDIPGASPSVPPLEQLSPIFHVSLLGDNILDSV